MRRPSPAARTMAVVGLTDMSEPSRTVVPGAFGKGDRPRDQNTREIVETTANHTTAIPAAHHGLTAIVVWHDGGKTAATTRLHVSAVARRAAFFFLSP